MTIGEKLHHLEHKLLDSTDDKAAEKARAEEERQRAAEEKLRLLQSKSPEGDKQLSSVPASKEYAIDKTDMPHFDKPSVPLHHRAEDTALRPESQEHANGVGTAGDDLAI